MEDETKAGKRMRIQIVKNFRSITVRRIKLLINFNGFLLEGIIL